MRLKLFCRYAHEPERLFGEFDEDTLTIGRLPEDNIKLNFDRAVSRRHAALYYDANSWWVRDVDSAHGTFVNGQPIVNPVRVPSGGVVQLGDTFLRLEYASEAADANLDGGYLSAERTLDPHQTLNLASESASLDILARVADIRQVHAGETALAALAREIYSRFAPRADHVTVLVNRDKELLALAYEPPGISNASSTLARRAVVQSSAFIWERSTASDQSQRIRSLEAVTAALYAPMNHNGRVAGVLHVDSTSVDTHFTEADRDLLSEIARCAALLLLHHEPGDAVPTVFVSYSRADKTFIQQLAADLRRRSISVWYDERLHAGTEWQAQLQRAIEATGVFILVVSPDSLKSVNVAWEIEHARRFNKPIIPLLYRPADMPDWLDKIQYINLGENYAAGLSELIHELRPA